MDQELKPARRLIGDAVLVEARLLRNRSEKTNAVSSLTALPHKPSLESEQVFLLTLSGPLN